MHRRESREHVDMSCALLRRADAEGLATLDTHARLATEPEPGRFYATSHMNARGNLMIASLLAARLANLQP